MLCIWCMLCILVCLITDDLKYSSVFMFRSYSQEEPLLFIAWIINTSSNKVIRNNFYLQKIRSTSWRAQRPHPWHDKCTFLEFTKFWSLWNKCFTCFLEALTASKIWKKKMKPECDILLVFSLHVQELHSDLNWEFAN